MSTFKQFLAELMIDVDPEMNPTQQMVDVRKAQLLAKRSPTRAIKAQQDQNKQALAAASASNAPSATLEQQIARKKDEIYRLQQRLVRMKKQEAAQQQQQGPATGV